MARRRKRDQDVFDPIALVIFAGVALGGYHYVQRQIGYAVGIWVATVAVLVAAGLVVRWWREQTAKTLVGRLAVAEQMVGLSWAEFEQACAELFRSMGFGARLTSNLSDDGVDIEIEKDGVRAIVQCKHWPDRGIGSPVVRDLLGARQDFRVSDAYLLTSGFFSQPAKALAERNPGLYLWDRGALIKIARQVVWEQLGREEPAHEVAPLRVPPVEAESVEAEPQTAIYEVPAEAEACPRCGRELVRKDGRRGASMSCSGFPQCRYSRDLTDAEAAE